MPVEGVNADSRAFVAKVLQVLAVGGVARGDKTLALGEHLCFVEKLPLLFGRDGNPDFPPALVPGILEHQRIAPIGPRRDDLDRSFTAQTEGSLQAQRHLGAGVADTLELFPAKPLCFGDVGDIHPVRYAVGSVGSSDDVVLAEFLYRPAQHRPSGS